MFGWTVAAGVLLPLLHLALRALEADAGTGLALLMSSRVAALFGRTLLLIAGVLTVSTLVAVPLAWLTTRTSLPGRGLVTLCATLPLAIPGYVMAYAWQSLGGYGGMLDRLFGVQWGSIGGFLGALWVLSLYNFTFLFLTLRAAWQQIDPSHEEAARSLGCGPWTTFWRVTRPQLMPAWWSGCLVIGLYVMSDFIVVSMMNVETFSQALFVQYQVDDQVTAAWLSLFMLALVLVALGVEWWALSRRRLDNTTAASPRVQPRVRLGRWTPVAWLGVFLVVGAGFLVPVATILFWTAQAVTVPAAAPGAIVIDSGLSWPDLLQAIWYSLKGSLPAALIAPLVAIPLALLSLRYQSRRGALLERAVYLGYATPALAFGLALIILALGIDRWLGTHLGLSPLVYQTLFLLVFAYTMHFLALALGPVRAVLYRATPRLEEAARSLGCTGLEAFRRVTLVLLKPGLIASSALVFLSVMKELSLTLLLAPIGHDTLAYQVWSHTEEVEFHKAAPYALTLLFFSGGFVALLLRRERVEATP